MNMRSEYRSGGDIPLGFGIALEQNHAMDTFLSLSPDTQQQMIDHTHSIQSKNEMFAYAQSIMGAK